MRIWYVSNVCCMTICIHMTKWKALFWRGVCCNIREEGIVWKYICTCVLFQWKMVEEPSCALFILLKNDEGNIM
jgi:hypothetical protein